ncbi:MAG: NACHT domain-containing protein [Deltaproteobacteria bacterium]|nr:MAG: NACHT domain-containing protein [Deltaproteobacteria bacterium]
MDLIKTLQLALAPFADPATEVSIVETSPTSCRFRFVRRGAESAGSATWSDGAITIKKSDGAKLSLASFLASRKMANLDQLAQVQVRVYESMGLGGDWIAGPAVVGGHLSDSVDAFRRGSQLLPGTTRILVVDGPAGMGKTTLCRRIALEDARSWQARSGTRLTLIVSSKGRRLSRLDDAIAGTLQDLRVDLYYPEVPVLVRHGLVNLVVDGFDELVNQDGYDTAWDSLSDLLEAVSGGGVLVLSARDTFFSEQEFVQRAQRPSPIWRGKLEFDFLRLQPWTEQEALALFATRGIDKSSFPEIADFLGLPGTSLLRPFFLERYATALQDEEEPNPDHLVQFVVNAFLRRESNLLFGSDPAGPAILRRFFWELASEMLSQERDVLELDVVQFYLDAVLEEEGVPEERRRQLVHRAGAVAFLDAPDGGGRGQRGFPHQIVSDYFIAEQLLSVLRRGDVGELERLLSMGVFGLDLSEAVLAVSDASPSERIPVDGVQALFGLASGGSPSEPLALNAAALAFALIRTLPSDADELRAADLFLGSVSLAGVVLPPLHLERCSFGFLDLSDSMAANMVVQESVIQRLRVSSATSLGGGFRADISSLETYTANRLQTVFDPARVRERLSAIRSAPGGDEPRALSEAEAVLESLTRRWLRQYYLDPTDSEFEPSFGSPHWPAVRKVLEHHNRLISVDKPSQGRTATLLHLKDPLALLNRRHADTEQQKKIDAIWRDVSEL